MIFPLKPSRPAASAGAAAHRPAQPEAESPAFDTAQVLAELQSAARHVRVPERASRSAADANVLFPGVEIAVLIPCHNEAATIGAVVADFRAALPQARIAVFDNSSSDATIAEARAAGAEVFAERRRGKGNVVRRMFAEISADVYVMADGDGTYDASSVSRLVAMIVDERVDMAIGARANVHADAHRAGHAIGNRLFNRLYGALFGSEFGDIFSGYRAFSRRFVKSFPALSSGFEIETEMSVHATQLRLPIAEIMLPYGKRPEGSLSKLSSIHDGWRILRAFAYLLKETRPAMFFGAPAAIFVIAAIVLVLPLVETYLATGLVPRLPTAILCTGLVILACMSATCGLILDSLARARVEQKRMLYLALTQRDG
ncbi:MAG: glycosyltransferase family 2 protein [Beijerinckiaceae bacterium]